VAAVFLARYGGEYRFADGEVVEARWVDAPTLRKLLGTELFCPDSVALVLPRILPLLADPGPIEDTTS
jgi:hypothetical protein